MGLEDIRISFGWRKHPKRIKLQRRLGAAGVLAIEDLWAHVAETKDLRSHGVLANMDAEDVAIAAGWDGDPAELVEALLDVRLLGRTDDGLFYVHDWDRHQGHVAQYDEYCEAQRERALRRWNKSKGNAPAMPPHSQGNAEGNAPTNQPTYLPTNQEEERGAPEPTPRDAPAPVPWQRVKALWNAHAGPAGYERLGKFPEFLRRKVRLLAEQGILSSEDDWLRFIRACNESEYLRGDVPDKHPPGPSDFAWLIDTPAQVWKVLKGRYAARASPEAQKQQRDEETRKALEKLRETRARLGID